MDRTLTACAVLVLEKRILVRRKVVRVGACVREVNTTWTELTGKTSYMSFMDGSSKKTFLIILYVRHHATHEIIVASSFTRVM